MYDLMDRPVTSLNPGGHLLLWAMRHWVRAVSTSRCPCGDVGPAFHKWDMMAGFPHFHVMMVIFNRHAKEKLCFGTVDYEQVSEHEALIMSLVRMMQDQPVETARGAAALIVTAEALPPLLIAMSAFAQAMKRASLSPAVISIKSDCTRFTGE